MRVSLRKSEQDYINVITELGAEIVGERRGKHRVLICLDPNKKKFTISVPSTPSDVRGRMNFATRVRRHFSTE